MSGTTTSPTACYIDAAGIHAPAFNDILNYFVGQTQAIYGSDIYLGNDSQDGQLLGIFAKAVSDNNDLAVAVYNSYSPSTAQGVGLSSVVKINGLTRQVATNSQVDVTLVGVAGTTITNGIITDPSGFQWEIFSTVVIPFNGQITATAVCSTFGAISLAANVAWTITTPTYGWQSVTNPQAAIPGAPIETDAALRQRQKISTSLPALSATEALVSTLEQLPGVTQVSYDENDTSITNANGTPGHSIALVIAGGDAQQIGQTIALKKTPGCGTYGTTSVSVVDPTGIPHTYSFFVPTTVTVSVQVGILPLQGYTTAIGNAIQAAVIDFINNLGIGNVVYNSRIIGVASLTGTDASTFVVTSVTMSRNGATLAAGNINIAFNETAATNAANVSLNPNN